MAQKDRDWYRTEQERRKQLAWNDRRGEIESDRGQKKGRGWWRLRRKIRVPWWIKEPLRISAWVAATYCCWWIYRHLIEPFIFR